MKKVALYCRVSSDDQKERDTIENQVEILHTFMEMKEHLEIYKEYLDNGISGTVPFVNRPGGRELLKDAQKGLFDTVLVWKIDRFGRDTLSGLTAAEMLNKYNIEIISITEPFDLNTPTGRFQFINYLNMAELERNNILDRMYLGATRAAKKGKWMGGIVPYGYVVNAAGYLEIKEDEAKIIRDIYSMYVEKKMSTLKIAVFLNSINIPSNCDHGKGKRTKKITGKWRSGSVLRVLSNTIYKGIHEYGKRGTRRKETIIRKVPAIVNEEMWDKAQKIKKENALNSERNSKKRRYLLRGLIICKECGKKYYGISYTNRNPVYGCAGKRGDNKKILGIKCENMNINADVLEEEVWSDCKYILRHYDKYIEDFKASTSETDKQCLDVQLASLQASLTQNKNEKNNILMLFRKNLIDEKELEEQLSEIRKEEESLKKIIDTYRDKLDIYKHKDKLIENISNKLKKYHNRINSLSFEEKREIVELLVSNIEIDTITEDGKRVPKAIMHYNLVKLEDCKDKDEEFKFDINKNFLPIIYKKNNTPGIRLKRLRLKNNLTLKELSKELNISSTTLMHVEQNKIKKPYYYWKLICDYFKISHINYIELYPLPEKTIQEKLWKIRILLGARTWEEVGSHLGYSESFITDMLYRYTPNKAHTNNIDSCLQKLKNV